MKVITGWNTCNLYNMVLELQGKVLLFKEERESGTYGKNQMRKTRTQVGRIATKVLFH